MKTFRHQKRKLKTMKTTPLLIDWKDKYCENGYPIKSNLHIHPTKNSNTIFHRNWKVTLNFIWKHRRFGISKIILNHKKVVETISDFKSHYRDTVIRTACIDTKTRFVDQWNQKGICLNSLVQKRTFWTGPQQFRH